MLKIYFSGSKKFNLDLSCGARSGFPKNMQCIEKYDGNNSYCGYQNKIKIVPSSEMFIYLSNDQTIIVEYDR